EQSGDRRRWEFKRLLGDVPHRRVDTDMPSSRLKNVSCRKLNLRLAVRVRWDSPDQIWEINRIAVEHELVQVAKHGDEVTAFAFDLNDSGLSVSSVVDDRNFLRVDHLQEEHGEEFPKGVSAIA